MRQNVSTIVIAGLAVLGSIAFACATPFAAIAALAAGITGPSLGLSLVLLAWLSNQAIGFLILGYPMMPDAFAWGGAIGLGAVLAFFAARKVTTLGGGGMFGQVSVVIASFVAFELTLYASGVVLGAARDAFSLATVERILAINLGAFVGALLLGRLLTVVSSWTSAAKPVPHAL